MDVLESSRARWGLGVTAGFVVLALIPVAVAQSRRPAAAPLSPIDAAVRALIEGRYDAVAAATEKLDQQDPVVVALNARADIARGRNEQAEARLRPVAERAPASEAALELGLLLRTLSRPDAAGVLERVAQSSPAANDAAGLARRGRALRALGRFYEANDAYRDAAAAAPRDPAINSDWGDLWLEVHGQNSKPEALKSYQTTLEADAKWAPAILGSARAILDDNPPQAMTLAGQALEINPSSVDAHVLIASVAAVDAGHHPDARKELEKALAVNPSSLEARSLVAAIDYVEDKKNDYQAEIARILALSPKYGEAYRVVAELTAQNYRFDEAVALARQGLALDPGNSDLLSDLGLDLLRTGDETAARAALEASFKINGFDVATYDLLKMMDRLDTFVSVTDGDITLRMSKEDAAVLQESALALSHRALDTLSKRYGFTPKGPFLIEMFPSHDDFAVRNAGLPGMVGALGACFGRVVTLDSPRADPTIPFQWEATLWHELAHVITIQMSDQRIPRWLTEGISVYEQKVARPEWARTQDMEFAEAMAAKETIKLKDLINAFQNPKLISIAYFQASLVIDDLVQIYGDDGLHKLIRAFARGVDTDGALQAELGTSMEQLQGGFDEYLDRRFGAAAKALAPPKEGAELAKLSPDELKKYAASHADSFVPQMLLGDALHKTGDLEHAVEAFSRAATLVPIAIGEDSPRAELAAIAIERKDKPRAMAELRTLLASDFDNVKAARQLASLMKEANVTDSVQLRPVYERIVAVDPFEADAHTMLGRLALGQNDVDVATREFKMALALKPVDQAAAHTDLADSLFRAGRRAEAKKETLAALEIAPTYERAQDLLLKLSEPRH